VASPSHPLIDTMHLKTAFTALLGLLISGANAHGLHESPVNLMNVAYNASIFILPGAQSPATVYIAKNRENDDSSRWHEWYLDSPNRFYTHEHPRDLQLLCKMASRPPPEAIKPPPTPPDRRPSWRRLPNWDAAWPFVHCLYGRLGIGLSADICCSSQYKASDNVLPLKSMYFLLANGRPLGAQNSGSEYVSTPQVHRATVYILIR
ncbi:unnamed protein product, partial [Mycena citricolor]